MIIESAVAKWVIAEAQKGTRWDDIVVHNPDKADEETIPVLIVPVARKSVATARARIEEALGRGSSM